MQPLNIFYPLKDSKSLLFNELLMQLLNHSRNFLRCFLILPILSLGSLYIKFNTIFRCFLNLFPGTLEKKHFQKEDIKISFLIVLPFLSLINEMT